MRRTALLLAVLTLGGCSFPHLSRAKAPPPPGPTPARIPDQVANTEPAPVPTNLPAPPPLAAPTAESKTPSAAQLTLPTPPNAPPPRPARAKRATKRPPVAPPAIPVETAGGAAPATAPTYRLGELRSPEEKERLKQQTEQMIGACNAALAAAEGKTLTAAQTEMLNRVRMFSQQARDAIEKDPGEARSFAAKGRTFAEILLTELK